MSLLLAKWYSSIRYGNVIAKSCTSDKQTALRSSAPHATHYVPTHERRQESSSVPTLVSHGSHRKWDSDYPVNATSLYYVGANAVHLIGRPLTQVIQPTANASLHFTVVFRQHWD